MDSLWNDLRFGLRMLIKHKGVTTTAVLALGLGVGLTTTMFCIVYGTFLRGLPFPEPEELMHIGCVRISETVEAAGVSIHDFEDWRQRQNSFDGLAAFYTGTINVSGSEGLPERYDGAFLTDNVLDVLRVQPIRGRSFRHGEDRPEAEPVAIISHRMWMNRFQGSPSVVGTPLRANGQVMTIIGVMPEKFRFPQSHDIWIPLGIDALALERSQGPSLHVVGRLADGVSQEQASTELANIGEQLEIDYPETNEGRRTVVQPYIHRFFPYEQRAGLFTMLAAVFGVLLVACANVANLLLARTLARHKEIAVRSALGAGRFRLWVQMFTETLVLTSIGSTLGLGVAYLGIGLFNQAIVDNPPPFWMDFRIDATVVGFVLFLTFIAAVLSGTLPSLRASGTDVTQTLKDESRGTSSLKLGRWSRAIVMMEIALSCALLLASSVMAMSIVALKNREYPFETKNILTARIALFDTDYPDDESRRRFFDRLESRLETLPGLRSTAFVSSFPALGAAQVPFEIETTIYPKDQDRPGARRVTVSPGSFEVFDITLLEGRDFRPSDDHNSPSVAIINQGFYEKYFTGESPLGKRLRWAGKDTGPWMTIVGVVPDVMTTGSLFDEPPEGIYVPLKQNPSRYAGIAIRAQGDSLALSSMVREQVMELDPNLPLYGVGRLSSIISNRTWFVDVFGSLFVIFGVAALLLAGIGLYGVMSFSVRRRTAELGLRRTFGAQTLDLLSLICMQGLYQLSVGMFIGIGLGLGISKLVEGLLYGVGPWSPLAIAVVMATMLATGVVACLVPAFRAVRVAPAEALRHE